MAAGAAAERVVEHLHGRWMYRACISVAFALRGNRDESWRWRKERTARVDQTGSRKKYKVLESGDLVTGRNLRPYRRAVGVVAKEKVEVFESCVVAWCKRGLRGKVLVEELQRASIVGCSVMRAAGDSVVLMFSSMEERRMFLDRIDLDQWFARVTVWNPESFERVHFLMETSSMKRIEETVEIIEWEDSVVQIQVQEIEIMHSHDIVCSCDRESDDGKRETRVNVL
ncbi:hypothetical protein V6N13_091153 [Hibiscus sabdariffa]